jgi:hypothetical protein
MAGADLRTPTLVLLFLAGWAASVHAAGDVAGTRVPASGVLITVVGGPADFRWARSLVVGGGSPAAGARWARAERFDPHELLAAPVERTALVTCWLDLSDAKRARLYFAAPSGDRFLLREVGLTGRFEEIDRASLAEVLDLSLAALLENERAGLSRTETEELLDKQQPAAAAPATSPAQPAPPLPPAPVPALPTMRVATVPHEPSRLLLGIAACFAEQVLSGDLPLAHRLGIELLGGRYHGDFWWAVAAAGEYQLSVGARNEDIGMDLRTVAVQAGLEGGRAWARPGPDTRFGWRSLFVRVGPGMNFDQIGPRVGTLGVPVSLAATHWSSSFVVRAAVGTGWALGGRVTLDVRLFADFLPTAVHYDVRRDGEVAAAFSPWRVRPGLTLALAVR